MRYHMQTFDLTFQYPVYFTENVFSADNSAFLSALTRLECGRRHRLFVVVDRGVAETWPTLESHIRDYCQKHKEKLELVAPLYVVEGGEAIKGDTDALMRLLNRFHELSLDRQAFVVIIGGGAVQDMAGFAAAMTHRGLRTVRLPTTVLSQNDSGVGVKNGINAFGTKNFLGTFAPPFAVLNDIRFLDTLTDRDKIAGMSEAVKVALIRKRDFFQWLCDNVDQLVEFNPAAMAEMIRWGALLHLKHIATSGDPFEFGAARPLDFGHWAAHKLESMTDYRLRHGEAVAIGMALDARYSVLSSMLDAKDCDRICDLLEKFGLRLWDDRLIQTDANGRLEVLRGLNDFQEHLGGELTVTLLEGIGCGIEVHEMDPDRIVQCVDWLRARDAR